MKVNSAPPVISIIVPVYNVESYLHCCLDSVISQSFTEWECILIDDGSSDISGKICDEYQLMDNRFHVVHQKNQGVSVARNAGLRIAKGKWIKFLDSDDWIDRNCLELLYCTAITENVEIVGSDYMHELSNESFTSIQKIDVYNHDLLKQFLRNKLHGGVVFYLIKKDLLNGLIFDEDIYICEDLLFTIKLFSKNPKTAYVSKALYHYRGGNNSSITHSFYSREKCLHLVKSSERIENVLRENNLYNNFIPDIIERKKYIKLKILYKCSLIRGVYFYSLYPDLSKKIIIQSPSALFHKILLFNSEIKNIPVVWLCLFLFNLFLFIKKKER